jgi:hypothetical protein
MNAKKNYPSMIAISAALAAAVFAVGYLALAFLAPRAPAPAANAPAVNADSEANVPADEPLSAAPGYRTYDVGEKSEFIRIDLPLPSDVIASPVYITGAAVGAWFFEGSFPVEIRDRNGNVLGSAPAQAKGDWMTADFVPFELYLRYDPPAVTGGGTLTFKKDNPSGLPEYDDSVTVPVNLSGEKMPCRPTGCSGQVCSDMDIITTCEYTAAYACYKTARCERQADGQCGWTQTAELESCLDKAGR